MMAHLDREPARTDNPTIPSIQTTGAIGMLSFSKNYDCDRCLNRLPSGRCKVLLQPPWGRTCGYYLPEDARLMSLPDDRIRQRVLRHAREVRGELAGLFPEITDEQVAESMLASASRSSTSRGARSTSRRALDMAAGEMGVECQRCGSEHDAAEVIVPDGTHRCPTCGGDEFAPLGVPGRRNTPTKNG